VSEDRGGREGLLQIVEGFSAGVVKRELHILLCQSYKWCDKIREVINKPSVEVREAKEGSYVLYVVRAFLVYDSLYFPRVHPYPVGANNVAKVDNFGLIELAFVDVKL
jgi:hypothetical protein